MKSKQKAKRNLVEIAIHMFYNLIIRSELANVKDSIDKFGVISIKEQMLRFAS